MADILSSDDAEIVETPETPAVEAAAEAEPEVEAQTTPEIPEGYTQDERGVWHRKDGTIASKDEIAKFGKGTEEAASVPTSPAEGDGSASATPVQPTPFKYKALQQEHALDGATIDANGNLVVSKEALPQLLPMLARAHEFPVAQSREARLTNEVENYKKQHREVSVRAEAAEFAYQSLAAILDDPERLTAFLTDPREKQYALKELQLGIRDKTLARASADREADTQAQSSQQSEAQELETISGAIDQLAKAPELAAFLTPEDLEDAKAYFKEMRPAVVKEATDDSLKAFGVSKGEKYVVHDPMQKYLARIATERKKAKDAAEAMKAAQKFNAPQTKAPIQKRPAVAAAAAPKKEKKSWDESFKGAWTAEDDE